MLLRLNANVNFGVLGVAFCLYVGVILDMCNSMAFVQVILVHCISVSCSE